MRLLYERVGHLTAQNGGFRPGQYLLLAASEYLLATKDIAFLQERVPFWNSNKTQTVLQALQRSVEFVVEQIGAGRHGIMRMLSSDWDDGFGAKDLVPASAYNVSESVLSAGLATAVLPRIAGVLESLAPADAEVSHCLQYCCNPYGSSLLQL